MVKKQRVYLKFFPPLLVLALFSFSLACPADAVPMRTDWVQIYRHADLAPPPSYVQDILMDLKMDNEGNVYVVGSHELLNYNPDPGQPEVILYDTASLIKYSPEGVALWEKPVAFSGQNHNAYLALDGVDCYVAGDEGRYWFLRRINPEGDGLGQYLEDPYDTDEHIGPIAVDTEKNIYLGWKNHLYRFSPGGWIGIELTGYRPTGISKVVSIAVDDDYVYITGDDFITEKYYRLSFTHVWTKHEAPAGSVVNESKALALDGQGNVYVTGTRTYKDIFSWPTSILTVKYGPDGSQQWLKVNGGNYSRPAGLVVDQQGNAYVTGAALNPARRFDRRYYRQDYYTAKYASADGAILWENYYNDSFNSIDVAVAIALDPDTGNLAVTGTCERGNYPIDPDFISTSSIVTVGYSPSGQRQWVQRYELAAGASENRGRAVAARGGRVAVAGICRLSSAPKDDFDWVTISYRPVGRREPPTRPPRP